MAGGEGVADLAFAMEAADARPLARARIDDHHRPLLRIDDCALGRDDAGERIVDRALEALAADQDLVAEGEHGRERPGRHVRLLVASLAQDVEKQDGALGGVDQIVPQRGGGGRRVDRLGSRDRGKNRRLESFGKRLEDRERILQVVSFIVVVLRTLRLGVSALHYFCP